jgi:hypothetical protein
MYFAHLFAKEQQKVRAVCGQMGLKWKVAEWSGLSINHHTVAQATFCVHSQKCKKWF